jgi:predicted nucleotidyltransferase
MTRNKFGLLDSELADILRVVSSRSSVEEACIFGSRAKGNFRPGSDVDIALKGKSVDHADAREIAYELNEEGILPYQFDIIDYNGIGNEALREHIDRVGAVIYAAENSIRDLKRG